MKVIDYLYSAWCISYTGSGKLGPKGCVALTLSLYTTVIVFVIAYSTASYFPQDFFKKYIGEVMVGLVVFCLIAYALPLELIYRRDKKKAISDSISSLTKQQKRNITFYSIIILFLPILAFMILVTITLSTASSK